jgi:uncharacterized delta-60 repeat protein
MKRMVVVCAAVVILATAGGAVAGAKSAGALDPTFGGDGTVMSSLTHGAASDVAIQGDGKIVAVGTTFGSDGDFEVARYNTDGTLDATFGGDGVVTTNFGGWDNAIGVAIQGDGKIVAVGLSIPGPDWLWTVARYNTDGSLDLTFGGDGMVTTNFTKLKEVAHDVKIQSDGKIVVAGESAFADGRPGSNRRFALARYNPNGTLDATFGVGGLVTTNFTPFADAVGAGGLAIQVDGKIVAVGFAGRKDANPLGSPGATFAIARYNIDGTPDATFGSDGTVTTDVAPSGDFGQAVAIQTDGKIVVGGVAGVRDFSGGSAGNGKFALVRYNPDGTLDPAFGVGGNVRTNLTTYEDEAHGLAIQADGKIVAVGIAGIGGPNWEAGLARYNTDGTLDATFGSGGTVMTDFTPEIDFAFAVALQGDGKIVTAGWSGLGGAHPKFALARYLPT